MIINTRLMIFFVFASFVLPAWTLAAESQPVKMDHLKRYAVKENFADVREMVELAITDRGLVVNHVSHIGKMLERTREVVGSSKQIYLKAEALEFCSAVLSRKMLETDPHNIVFCPYIIFVYVLPDQPDTVYIAYRRPLANLSGASAAVLAEVEHLLESIVQDVL